MTWTVRQLAILETTTRVGSVFSLLGAGFIILTFCVSQSFHKPINRLAFFAAFGNIMTNVATLISQDAVKAYHKDPHAPICKMQAMFIQWFMPADALFCAAMAFNVYLTVFRKFSSHRLQKLEIPYILFCYGVPLIPALVFLFIGRKLDGEDAPLYGPATLWCWISDEWQILRIATFYGPVWLVLLFTFAIYILAGRVIFKLRGSLRLFARDPGSSTITTGTGNYGSGGGTVTSITPAAAPGPAPPPGAIIRTTQAVQIVSNTSTTVPILSDPSPVAGAAQQQQFPNSNTYSCTVETGERSIIPTTAKAIVSARHRSAVEANTAAWAYCRCAMLFFLALVITWLPSSINRVYTVIYPGTTNFGLHFTSALVLPCQGFWNGLIYVMTTVPACKQFFLQVRNQLRALVGKPPINPRRGRRRPDHEYRHHAGRVGGFGERTGIALQRDRERDVMGKFDKKIEEDAEVESFEGIAVGMGGIGMGNMQRAELSSLESIATTTRPCAAVS
ncbi:hypothetical protein BDZ91DRAFT_781750 [Kalaharituber pfeilii]|nr:hypothetical protein BDZ91DRAFT_781750 [Kalaharituber pfeilii]